MDDTVDANAGVEAVRLIAACRGRGREADDKDGRVEDGKLM